MDASGMGVAGSRPVIITTDDPSDMARAEILAILRRFTTEAVAVPDNRDFGALVTHPVTGTVLGGLVAQSRWGAMFIDMIALSGELRGQGIGSELMRLAETEARRRECYLMWLDTYDFQARLFYERHGFSVFGQLDGPKPIYPRYFMRKVLEREE